MNVLLNVRCMRNNAKGGQQISSAILGWKCILKWLKPCRPFLFLLFGPENEAIHMQADAHTQSQVTKQRSLITLANSLDYRQFFLKEWLSAVYITL